jgi:hypothetical protein
MFKKLLLFAVIASLFLTVSILAQSGEYEPVSSSDLTSVSLPGGAQRVFPNHVPSEINQTLESIISRSEGKLRRGDTEVLLWTGNELKRTGATTIVNRLTDTLKVAGWKFEIGGTENGVTFFSVLKGGASRRAVIGFYGEADGTLFFAWSELHIAGDEQTNSNPASYNRSGDVSDYSFTTPAGWSRHDGADKIVLSKGSANKIEFLPLMNSSGNLERDAEKIIWQVFKGYDAWYSNGFEADWGIFEKGRTVQGLEYYRVYRYAKKASDENNGFAQSKFDAIILLVKLGSQVAVIAGSQPFQSDYSRDSTVSAIDLILYDLSFKSATDSYNLKNELLGSWSAAGGSVGLAYTFNANGTFHKGSAHEFRVQHDPQTQKVKTTTFATTQNYSLSGNILTQNYQPTGQVAKYKIRVYYTKYDKDAWQHKLGFLPVNDSSGGTIVLKRSS